MKGEKIKMTKAISIANGGMSKEEKIQEYLRRIDRLMNLLVRRLHVELAQHLVTGITGSQFIILKKIQENGKMTVSEVANDLYVSLSAITAQIDRMFRTGLVSRTRDEGDRRVVWLELTPAGEEVCEACQASRLKVMGKYLKKLEETDLENLLKIYEKLLAIIEDETEDSN